MAEQKIKHYQVGTYAVGNRLLDPEQRSVQARMDRSNTLTSGHRACRGCGEALGARYIDAAMRATGGKLIAANATGCLEVFSTPFPSRRGSSPGSTPCSATPRGRGRCRRGAEGQGEDVRVIGQAGDGGTVDIGFAHASRGCSSAAMTCSSSATTTRPT